jgi:SAM-dependent methyltransferase
MEAKDSLSEIVDQTDSIGDRLQTATASQVCCNDRWEQAYQRFETPAEEVAKFRRRLTRLGAREWPRDAKIVELFCGRGNGLHALTELGFTQVEGIDLSASLLARYTGPVHCKVADCRALPYSDCSKDVVIIQGGLHHLPRLPEDLERTLSEARRVLRRGGLLGIVEPWSTPFLSLVHAVSRCRLVRRLSDKLDAFEIMYEEERETYDAWLSQHAIILNLLSAYFVIQKQRIAWGKLEFLGKKPA